MAKPDLLQPLSNKVKIMFPKTLTLTLLCVCYLSYIHPIESRSVSDTSDAEQAFQDLLHLAENLKEAAASEMDILIHDSLQSLQIQQNTTIVSINSRYREKESSMEAIANNTLGVNVTDWGVCFFFTQEIKDFPKRYTDKVKNCTLLASSVLSNMGERLNAEMDVVVTDLLRCYNRSLQQCLQFGDEGCSDFVIEKIERAKDTLRADIQLILADFLNHLWTFKLPCQRMVEYEMSVDPAVRYQPVVDCLENEILRWAVPSMCQR